MSISMGTSLSGLTAEMLRPGVKTPPWQEKMFSLRTVSAADIEERQKRQQLEMLNSKLERHAESDAFFLEFTAMRGTAVCRRLILAAKAVESGGNDKVMTTNNNPADEELERSARREYAEAGEVIIRDIELDRHYADDPEFLRKVAQRQQSGPLAHSADEPRDSQTPEEVL